MLGRLRQPMHHALLTRALFSTEPESASSLGWTIQQRVAGAASAATEIINIKPDGNVTVEKTSSQDHSLPSSSPTLITNTWRHLITHQLQSTFLPAGYPHTVAPNYLKYVTWQALHHTAGAANGVLASTFLLYSVGLGAGAIPTAGALSWILKDGLGQLGTLLFGRTMAHNFDLSSRSWYVAASGKLNLAMALEISTALAPHWFLPLGSTANAVKGLAWMAGGSSRSAFNVAFAKDRNIADVTAKATSQTICTSLLGTAAGMAIAASIEQSAGLCFTWYSALAAVHMYTAVESAKSVPLKTLNPSRLKKLAELVVFRNENNNENNNNDRISSKKEEHPGNGLEMNTWNALLLPTPAELAVEDKIFPFLPLHSNKKNSKSTLELVVGTSLRKLIESSSTEPEVLAALLPLYKHKKYILTVDKHNKMHLVLHEEAETVDVVTAVLQATVWTQQREKKQKQRSAFGSEEKEVDIYQEVQNALQIAEKMAPKMVDDLRKAGWDVQGVVIEPQRRRATW